MSSGFYHRIALALPFGLASTHAGVWQCRPAVTLSGRLTAGARFHTLAVPSFSRPLHQPRAGIPAGTDEMFDVLHLLSHGASRRTSGSSRGAVSALPPVRFPDPPAEPDMPIPEHPALHRTSAARSLMLVSQRRSPAGWWPALSRGPPTARGAGARESGPPDPRRPRDACGLQAGASRAPSTAPA